MSYLCQHAVPSKQLPHLQNNVGPPVLGASPQKIQLPDLNARNAYQQNAHPPSFHTMCEPAWKILADSTSVARQHRAAKLKIEHSTICMSGLRTCKLASSTFMGGKHAAESELPQPCSLSQEVACGSVSLPLTLT